jgi:aldehyde dehydrogenase (NAD(P)+)
LCNHEGVDHIHITGGAKTYDSIVFGSGEDGAERKQKREKKTNKSITAELGCVTPIIVVPGPWSKADIKYQAENIATQKLHNASFNCVAGQVLILPEEWDKSKDLLTEVKSTSSKTTARDAYNPGSKDRHESIKQNYGNCDHLDENEKLSRLFIPDLDHKSKHEYLFQNEVFVGALAQTSLSGISAKEYLINTIQFCNEKLWGTLGANIIIHPKTIKQLGSHWENIIADLKYGSIGVNTWCALAFLTSECTWGAFPGHSNVRKASAHQVFTPIEPYLRSAIIFSQCEPSCLIVFGCIIIFAPSVPHSFSLQNCIVLIRYSFALIPDKDV